MNNNFNISYPQNLQILTCLNLICGSGIPGSKINVLINNKLKFETTVDCNGCWKIVPICNFTEGLYIIDAVQNFNCQCSCCKIHISIQNFSQKPMIISPQNNSTINDNQPLITGTAIPRSTVNIYLEKLVALPFSKDLYKRINKNTTVSVANITVAVNNCGVYKAKVPNILQNGLYNITVAQLDFCGNIVSRTTISVNIQNIVEPPTITYPPDNSTIQDNQPVITGTAIPGNIVTICADAYGCITTQVDNNGLYSAQFNVPFKNDTYAISAFQTDPLGNVSETATNTVTIQKIVPAPIIFYPPNGAVIEDSQPTITGSAIPGNTVNICIDSLVCVDTSVDANGLFSVQYPVELSDDTYILSATQIDSLGNVSSETKSTFTINSVNPVPSPTISYPINGSVIQNRQPLISGTGESGDTVEICLSGLVDYGCLQSEVGISGLYEVQFPQQLPEGGFTIKATQINSEGKRSKTVTSNFTIQAIIPVPDPKPIFPENGSTISDPKPFFTGTGIYGDSVKLCLTLPDNTVVCESTTIDSSDSYSIQFTNELANGAYILNTTQIDGFGNESTPVTTNFTVNASKINIDTLSLGMGYTFRSMLLNFQISGDPNKATAYYLLLPPNSEAPSISDMKNYPNSELLLNGTVARGQFELNITTNVTPVSQVVYGKDGITPIPGEIGIVDGYNYDGYIYVEVNPSLNSGVINFGNIAMGMPFAGGLGSEDSPYEITNLTSSELVNYPDLLAGNPYNIAGVTQNARMLDNIERLQTLYDESNEVYGLIDSLSLNYILTSDFDLSNYATAYDGNGWIPIGNVDYNYYEIGPSGYHIFSGTLDGGNYIISNVSITPKYIENSKYVSHVGFIGNAEFATISNINFEDVTLIANTNIDDGFLFVGGLIARASMSDISSINFSKVNIDTSLSVVNTESIEVGGIIGDGVSSNIVGGTDSNSILSDITIKTNGNFTNYCGAITGHYYTELENSINNYEIINFKETSESSDRLFIGSVCGNLDSSGPLTISNISLDGLQTESKSIKHGGGLVGLATVTNNLTINNIILKNIILNSSQGTSLGGVISSLVINPLDNININIYNISIGNVFNLKGYISTGGIIGLFETIKNTSSNVNVNIYDFNINTKDSSDTLSLESSYNCGGIIGSISREDTSFIIYIHDGNIYNTNVTIRNNSLGGLIGIYLSSKTTTFLFIENCNCSEMDIKCLNTSSGNSNVGGLFGYSSPIALKDCSFIGTLSGRSQIGGLVGYGTGIYISNSKTNAQITGDSRIGGLCGYVYPTTILQALNPPFPVKDNVIELSNSSGSISIGLDQVECGGLIGYNNAIDIDQCFSNVNIDTIGNNTVSTLIGYNTSGKITNSYSTGTLASNDSMVKVGGIVGDSSGSISFCYSTSNVSGASNIGGITGFSLISITSCFALSDEVNASASPSGRISGEDRGTFTTNYAIDTLILYENGAIITPTNDHSSKDGDIIALANLQATMIAAGWSSSIWDFSKIATLGRPTLINNPE